MLAKNKRANVLNEKLHDLTVGRELKMKQMEKKIKQLKVKLRKREGRGGSTMSQRA
jgi:dynactin complex subunit